METKISKIKITHNGQQFEVDTNMFDKSVKPYYNKLITREMYKKANVYFSYKAEKKYNELRSEFISKCLMS